MSQQYAQDYGQAVGEGVAKGAAAGAQEQASGMCSCNVLDREFVKSIPGILKVVQMVLSLIGFICVTTGNKLICPYGSAFGWYEFVSMGAFWSTFALYLLYLLKCQDRCCACPWLNWNFIELIYLGIVIICWFIAAIVMAVQNCGQGGFQAGSAFGFFALAAYGANEYFVARTWWAARQEARNGTTGGTGNLDPSQPQFSDPEMGGNKY
ncbi:unnamed protein product [Owenia fusiformis]|uniref:Uncharacterized protein n=1 Tax=Owenia fusiformis TaxID=6347 RepID=A0A8J1TJQ6_OWEFU|nr:unnamed protein product [Owenia fusiformis]